MNSACEIVKVVIGDMPRINFGCLSGRLQRKAQMFWEMFRKGNVRVENSGGLVWQYADCAYKVKGSLIRSNPRRLIDWMIRRRELVAIVMAKKIEDKFRKVYGEEIDSREWRPVILRGEWMREIVTEGPKSDGVLVVMRCVFLFERCKRREV